MELSLFWYTTSILKQWQWTTDRLRPAPSPVLDIHVDHRSTRNCLRESFGVVSYFLTLSIHVSSLKGFRNYGLDKICLFLFFVPLTSHTHLMIPAWPSAHAAWRGVHESASCLLMSAPCSIRSRTAIKFPSNTAWWSGVKPLKSESNNSREITF